MPPHPESGRPLPDPGFAGDEGGADPMLIAALAAYHDGSGDDASVVTALAASRLIVPVTALPAETEPGPDGLVHDTKVEMALPVMIGTDGRRALPAFTSLTALAAWDPAARPVPVETRRAALGALQEDCAFLVIDPAGPVTWVAERAQVEALAAGR
jgi:type III secretion system (T3SS) SseB-like protein